MDRKCELEIIQEVLSGDRAAFAELVDDCKGPIFNLAFRMTGSYSDADDLTQEIFLRAYLKLHQFDQNQKFFTWLYTLGINLIRNHLREKARKEKSDSLNAYREESLHLTDASRAPEELEESITGLEMNMQKLPVDLREALILKYLHDLTFEEVAAITGCSASAAKMRVYRALEKLKDWMK